MEAVIRENSGSSKPKLLLHACCAPCSTAVLESLVDFFDITLFFYNPNIENETEFQRRADECKRLVKEMGLPIHCIVTSYIHREFLDIAKGLEKEPERGERCTACFQLRLEETAAFASRWNKENPENPFDYYCTSLSISPLKDAERLNKLGMEIGKNYGISCHPTLKRKDATCVRLNFRSNMSFTDRTTAVANFPRRRVFAETGKKRVFSKFLEYESIKM